MTPTADARRPVRRRWVLAVGSMAAVSLCTVMLLGPAAAVGAQPGATTSTLPVDDRTFGDIIPEPNSGRAPETPGDPGGWLQVSLFFVLCAVVFAIAGFVWWQSRSARDRRRAAGLDPLDVARARGEGTRKTPS